mgnify:FL=1
MSNWQSVIQYATALTIIGSMAVLSIRSVLLMVLELKTCRSSSPLKKGILAAIVISAICIWNHIQYPVGHRLLYDDEVYANMSVNLFNGHGATVTDAWVDSVKSTHAYKWPMAYPLLMIPAVAILGPEKGPALFNEVTVAVTLVILLLGLWRITSSCGVAILGTCIYGLHPVTGCWSTAGAAEPLSVLFLVLSVLAAAMVRMLPDEQATARSNGFLISILAGLLALHVRLENLLLILPLLVLLPGRHPALSYRQRNQLWLMGGALFTGFVLHVLTLKEYYLAGRPESAFSPDSLFWNLYQNTAFGLYHGSLIYFFLTAILCGFIFLKFHSSKNRPIHMKIVLSVLILPVSHFALLLFYSGGQYNAPGGSRFYLLQIATLAVASSMTLAFWLPQKLYRVGLPVLMVIYLTLLPGRYQLIAEIDRENEITLAERQAVVNRWAPTLPKNAVVLSMIPCLWEHAGVHSVHPSYYRTRMTPEHRVPYAFYEHVGPFNESRLTTFPRFHEVDRVRIRDKEIRLLQETGGSGWWTPR